MQPDDPAPRDGRLPQVNFAASGIGPGKVGSTRRNSITSVSASADQILARGFRCQRAVMKIEDLRARC